MMIMVILSMVMGSGLAVVVAAILLLKRKTPPPEPVDGPETGAATGANPPASTEETAPADSLTKFKPNQIVKLSKDGTFARLRFYQDRENKCESTVTASGDGGAFVGRWMVSAFNSGKSIKPNCDQDGKHTSHLMDLAPDPVQPKVTAEKQQDKATWTITCPSASTGCTIALRKNPKRFLDVTPAGAMTVSGTKNYWKFSAAD